MTCSTAITLRNQAQYFLRLALDADDRPVREKYIHAAREVLAEMEREIEISRNDCSKEIDRNSRETELASGNAGQMKIKHDSESEDNDDDGQYVSYEDDESDDSERRGDCESEEDQQWTEENDTESDEERDLDNGEDSSQPPIVDEPCLAHYLTNGPGKNKAESAQGAIHINNLDVRVYARMMELFEIESRHRMSVCNSEYALLRARDDFARLEMSKQ
ncbi:hypothetical protein E6O75_ATG03157 [Venturia nashicola]|uniref:Uncharacterized protein n=1 Tax=Venturia nashicola TaxID=86259 RepID=A0A4Z1PEE9_9PEZI|nr:hypothetical protein E6O75_ATG03157 [Venturia nashicola]